MAAERLPRLLRLSRVLDIRGSLATGEAAALLGVDKEVARRDLLALVGSDPQLEFVGRGRERRVRRRGPRGLAVTFGERLALHFGRQLMEFVGGTTIPTWLDELAHKLDPVTDRQSHSRADHLRRRFRFVSEPFRSYAEHDDVLNELLTAILDDRELCVDYGSRRYERLQPYTLVVYRRALYLVGRVPGRPGTLTLALDRMTGVRRLDRCFRLPEGYDPDEILAGRFGIWADPPAQPVRLRFTADRADLVRARTWHPTARFEEVEDGRLDLVMLAGGRELVRAALEWGPKCEVIEPAWLRAEVVAELRAAVEIYESTRADP